MPGALETNRYYEFGPYRLDRKAKVLLRGGVIVPLTPKVLDTLAVLVQHRGEVVSKDELLKAVWPDAIVEEGNLSQNVSVLRKTLGRDSSGPAYIETVSKRGYRFAAEVRTACVDEDRLSAASPSAVMPLLSMRAAVGLGVVLTLGGAFAAWQYRQARPSIHGIRSLAVLPLKNLSGDPEQEYFADAMTDLLTAEISRLLSARVTSRSSAMCYRDSKKPVAAIARELNVDAVVEGSIIRSGDRLRITAQLIHASSDRHLWAETYDRELTDGLVLQHEIARALAHEIRDATRPVRGDVPGRVNRSTFENYLRARYHLAQRTTESITKAISFYKKAIGEDPAYARAYAGLADCYNQLGTVVIGDRSPSESGKLAIAAATRALEIEPHLADAHAALGYSYLYEWKWAHARESLERAVSLNPNYAPAHVWRSHYFAARAQFEQALQEIRLARDLDPLSPIVQTQVGWTLRHAGRFSEAIREFRRALGLEPEYHWAKWQIARTLIDMGDFTGAIDAARKSLEPDRPAASLAALGEAYGLAGQPHAAEKVLNEMFVLRQHRYVPAYLFVNVYCGLRDREKVFEWLEKSYEERSNALVWLGVLHDMDWLRADPRFDNLLRRVGLKNET